MSLTHKARTHATQSHEWDLTNAIKLTTWANNKASLWNNELMIQKGEEKNEYQVQKGHANAFFLDNGCETPMSP